MKHLKLLLLGLPALAVIGATCVAAPASATPPATATIEMRSTGTSGAANYWHRRHHRRHHHHGSTISIRL